MYNIVDEVCGIDRHITNISNNAIVVKVSTNARESTSPRQYNYLASQVWPWTDYLSHEVGSWCVRKIFSPEDLVGSEMLILGLSNHTIIALASSSRECDVVDTVVTLRDAVKMLIVRRQTLATMSRFRYKNINEAAKILPALGHWYKLYEATTNALAPTPGDIIVASPQYCPTSPPYCVSPDDVPFIADSPVYAPTSPTYAPTSPTYCASE